MSGRYFHERGMGSKSKHGKKVRRWDNHQFVKYSARKSRHNVKIKLMKEF